MANKKSLTFYKMNVIWIKAHAVIESNTFCNSHKQNVTAFRLTLSNKLDRIRQFRGWPALIK